MQDFVIIVAGGVGRRMGTALPKQFLEVEGRPVIHRTIDNFTKYNPSVKVVVVLHPEAVEIWQALCDHFPTSCAVEVALGGTERFYSVRNGLEKIKGDTGVVAVHDAVRPFADQGCIERCFSTAREFGNAIPVIPVIESLREISGDASQAVDRSDYRLVQTPQCFDVKLLKDAYAQEFDPSFTDDASVVERLGVKINLVEGNRENIKLTTKEDLSLASSIAQSWD
ncbi:MAG: 2-C-methyl-D-erythritol 4-phosphate cytidylyltransferase [Flavobacteriales bacterium]|nr:2-C-methyl-D-erythritol 4-phosphate cytidylyltransferase [Flavobacteriales bacterium]